LLLRRAVQAALNRLSVLEDVDPVLLDHLTGVDVRLDLRNRA
jgi:hypothetical protein